jgi:hypothetical protein
MPERLGVLARDEANAGVRRDLGGQVLTQRPSTSIASAAFARPGPMDAATVVPVTARVEVADGTVGQRDRGHGRGAGLSGLGKGRSDGRGGLGRQGGSPGQVSPGTPRSATR